MKKLTAILVSSILMMSLVSCVGEKQSSSENTEQLEQVQQTEQEEKDPGQLVIKDIEEVGEGSIYLTGPGGTTEDGSTLKVFSDKETMVDQIGLETSGVDGSHLSYIYLDGELVDKQQLSDSQMSIDLMPDKGLREGLHQIIVKQYENDEETGSVIMLKEMKYEVEMK